MTLTLNRHHPGKLCTIGDLLIDGEFFCHSLEDLPRPVKVKGETRIPEGLYDVLLTVSPAVNSGKLWSPIGNELPLLVNVPGFDGVRIHAGNTDKNTQGCILLGDWEGGEFIKHSRKVLERFCALMVVARATKQSVRIEICDDHSGKS